MCQLETEKANEPGGHTVAVKKWQRAWPRGIGWSDLPLFAIFEKGHIAAD